MSFTYAELFAGILGFGTALDELGGKPVFISEIDKFAQQAIRALGKGDLLHGDITKIEAAAVPDHDFLVGGFPCQAFSVAGRRLGFQDMRGTLFFEAVRIAKEKKPKAILLENVKGLVNHEKGDTISAMLHALNDIGYIVDLQILNSKFFGVPQNRERIYIVAVRADLAKPQPWIGTAGKTVIPRLKSRLQQEGVQSFNFAWPQQKEITARLSDILEPEPGEDFYLEPDRLAALQAQAETGGSGLAIREATKKGYAIAAPGDAVNFQFPNSLTRRGRVGKQIANTLEASGVNQGVVLKEGGAFRVRKFTPLESWRLQAFSDDAFHQVKAAGVSSSQLYKQAGNAVTVNVIRAVAEKLQPFLY